jgi:hypothetical protein
MRMSAEELERLVTIDARLLWDRDRDSTQGHDAFTTARLMLNHCGIETA